MSTAFAVRLRPHALLALPILALLAGPALADQGGPTAAVVTTAKDPAKIFEEERTGIEQDLSELSSQLEGLLQTDDVKAAERLYGIERRAIATLVYGARNKIATEGETHDQTMASLRAMLQRVLRYQERVKEHAQDKLDRVLPGEPERKLIQINGQDRYKPLFRQGTPVPGQAAQTEADRLKEMEQDFIAKGGDLARDISLLGPTYLKTLRSGELAEWTQVSKDQFSITSKGAKHPVILSEGKKRIGAGKDASRLSAGGGGSAKVWTDHNGEIILAIASNSSGNLKPGPASVESFVGKLVDIGVREERILTTSIVPEEPELVKLLLKARPGMTKEQINLHVSQLKKSSTPALASINAVSDRVLRKASVSRVREMVQLRLPLVGGRTGRLILR